MNTFAVYKYTMRKYPINKKFWMSHVIWLITFCVFFSMSVYFQPAYYAFISSIFNTFVIFSLYMVTTKILFPRYYKKGIDYFIISFFTVVAFSIIFLLVEIYIIPEYHNPAHEKPPLFFLFMRFFMTLGLSFFIGTSVSLMQHFTKLKEKEKVLIEEKLETELKLLKAQINPHFIFNALNNIYSLTYMKSQKAPESVLKLSEMLRYVFYDCNKDRVTLSSEIKYIENFNAFQQMKSDCKQNIGLIVDQKIENNKIAPMLLIPFLENAYKYSRIEENEDAFVRIEISGDNETLHFKIENSISQQVKSSHGSGIGIKNVQHRLDIIYPGQHELKIEDLKDIFRVELLLKL